jgi:hypothetical protein
MNNDLLNGIPGGPDLIAWFDGVVPSFHDAEIVELALTRANSSCRLKVHGFQINNDAEGFRISVKHVVITFQLDQITELELTDFNHQNVIDGPNLTRTSNGTFLLVIEPCYGLWGKIEAASLQISIEPRASTIGKAALPTIIQRL